MSENLWPIIRPHIDESTKRLLDRVSEYAYRLGDHDESRGLMLRDLEEVAATRDEATRHMLAETSLARLRAEQHRLIRAALIIECVLTHRETLNEDAS